MKTYLWTAFLSFLPISEIRGGLPYALSHDINGVIAYFYCVFFNILISPLLYLFLSTGHKFFYRYKFYARLFDRMIEKKRQKIMAHSDRWGFWGIVLFVGIPLPISGAWTGTLAAWILGLNPQRSIIAIGIGVAISGLIVSSVYLLGIEALKFFIKHV